MRMRKINRNYSASINRLSQLFQFIYCYDQFLCFLSFKFYGIIRSQSYISAWLLVLNYWTLAVLTWVEVSFLPLLTSQCFFLKHVLRNLYFIEHPQHFWMPQGIFSQRDLPNLYHDFVKFYPFYYFCSFWRVDLFWNHFFLLRLFYYVLTTLQFLCCEYF